MTRAAVETSRYSVQRYFPCWASSCCSSMSLSLSSSRVVVAAGDMEINDKQQSLNQPTKQAASRKSNNSRNDQRKRSTRRGIAGASGRSQAASDTEHTGRVVLREKTAILRSLLGGAAAAAEHILPGHYTRRARVIRLERLTSAATLRQSASAPDRGIGRPRIKLAARLIALLFTTVTRVTRGSVNSASITFHTFHNSFEAHLTKRAARVAT